LVGVGTGYPLRVAVVAIIALVLAAAVGFVFSYPAGQLAFAVAFAIIGAAFGSWLMLALSLVVALGGAYFLYARRRERRPLWRD
jgi:hypothetical protein